jgi:hypothetical protein
MVNLVRELELSQKSDRILLYQLLLPNLRMRHL